MAPLDFDVIMSGVKANLKIVCQTYNLRWLI